MKPLFIKKNGTVSKVSGIVMPASYPASRVSHESVSVTADGVKTYATLLNELFALVDFSKVTVRTKLHRTGDEIFALTLLEDQISLIFSFCYTFAANDTIIASMSVTSSGSKYTTYKISGSFSDRSNNVPTSGEKITIYYD